MIGVACHMTSDANHVPGHMTGIACHVTSVCLVFAGVAGGQQQTGVHQLLQDEDVCHPGHWPDVLWSPPLHLQSHVSHVTPT